MVDLLIFVSVVAMLFCPPVIIGYLEKRNNKKLKAEYDAQWRNGLKCRCGVVQNTSNTSLPCSACGEKNRENVVFRIINKKVEIKQSTIIPAKP